MTRTPTHTTLTAWVDTLTSHTHTHMDIDLALQELIVPAQTLCKNLSLGSSTKTELVCQFMFKKNVLPQVLSLSQMLKILTNSKRLKCFWGTLNVKFFLSVVLWVQMFSLLSGDV